MKLSSRAIVILVVTSLIIGPSACFIERCNDTKAHFIITGLEADHREIVDRFTNSSVSTQSVSFEDYLLRISFRQEFVAEQIDDVGASLFARDCYPPGYEGTKVGLDTLYLVTELDYNDQFLKGDTLNSIVDAGPYEDNLYSLDYLVQEWKENIPVHALDISLRSLPSQQSQICRFKFSLILKDGSKFESITPDVILTW